MLKNLFFGLEKPNTEKSTFGYLSQGLPGLNNVGRGQKSRPELRTKTTEGGGENAARQHT